MVSGKQSAVTREPVQLWLLPTAKLPAAADWQCCLDADERRRAARFLRGPDREHFVAAHVLLRALLASIGGLAPAAWPLVADARGKPRIEGRPAAVTPSFSLSHTPGLVAAAADPGGAPVGIDVEPAGRAISSALARRILTPEEQRSLAGLDEEPLRRALLRRWVLKEALAKAVGKGLALPFTRIGFPDDDPPMPRFEPAADLGRPDDWHVETWRPTGTHLLAVAIGGGRAHRPRVESTILQPDLLARLVRQSG